MDNSEICAVCGGVYGLHNHMNKACPKDINADRNHTEYRKTVFSSTPQPLTREGDVTALTELKQWVDEHYPNFNKADIEGKIADLLPKEREREDAAYRKGFIDGGLGDPTP